MKKRMTTIVGAVVLSAVLVLSGCASTRTGTDRGDETSRSMQAVEEDIGRLVVDIDAAGYALESLIRPNQPDKEAAFVDYSAAVKALEKSSGAYRERSDEMGELGRDYFDEWRVEGTEYQNPRIRSLSEQRRGELGDVYSEIANTSVGVQGSVDSHVNTLEEIRTYFTTDLTPRGIQVMTPTAEDAIADGDALTDSLEEVLDSIGDVRYELASGDDRN